MTTEAVVSESGSGLAFSADPLTGHPGLTGRFRAGATGEALLTRGGDSLAALLARGGDSLADVAEKAEQDGQGEKGEKQGWTADLAKLVEAAAREAGGPVRLQFVVNGGQVTVVMVDPVPATGATLVEKISADLGSGRLTEREALAAVDEKALGHALTPRAEVSGLTRIAVGLGVSPGIVSGTAVFSAAAAVEARERGEEPVLVLRESLPEDLPGLLAAVAVVTTHGGSTSHAAVVARGLGRVGVTALRQAEISTDEQGSPVLRPARGELLTAGEPVTVDGSTGQVFLGRLNGSAPSAPAVSAEAVTRLLAAADRVSGVAVRANADSPEDAARARAGGARGIGLCRIEHMLLGERGRALADALSGSASAAVGEALGLLRIRLQTDFEAMLRAMEGLPVTVRLLDPPRHEFLPHRTDLWETNPMLGIRGVRLAAIDPHLLRMQLCALLAAVLAVRRAGVDAHPELLVPMVALPGEVDLVRKHLMDAGDDLGCAETAAALPVGAMIETPRAALVAGSLARAADFLSFGTNDLTALVWGLSRDDADRELLPAYQDLGLLDDSPFARWDGEGVGELVRRAVQDARSVDPDIRIGVCGEHAIEPSAVRLFASLRVDYLSCSTPRLGVARLAAGRAATS